MRPSPIGGPARVDARAALGWLSLALLGALTVWLEQFEWLDAWVTTHMAALRGCGEGASATMLTDAAPYCAALALAVGVGHAWRNGHRRHSLTILWGLVVALVLVQTLKLTFERDRPGVPPFAQSGSQSFPSGHTANAALAIAAALAVTRETTERRARAARIALALAGAASIAAVGFTRLYLNRHWATDVLASVLVGLAFWGLATAPRGPTVRRLVAFVVVLAIPGLLLASAAGGRVHLPAPSTLRDPGAGDATVLRHTRLQRVVGGAWVPRPRAQPRGFLRVDAPGFQVAVRSSRTRRAVLKVVATPLGALAGNGRCAWIEVRVDGRPVARRPLKRVWRVYAFALPLEAGWNDVHVTTEGAAPGRSALGIQALSIDGRPAAPAIVATARTGEPPPRERGRGCRAGRC